MIDSKNLKSINPFLQNVSFQIRPRPYKNFIIGILLLISIIPTICICAFLISLAVASRSCWMLFILFGSLVLVTQSFRLALRYLHNPLKYLKDSRKPVLFLRPFSTQSEEDSDRLDRRTPEELLAKVLYKVGPVIAVGQPNDIGLPLLGATRIYLSENWKLNVAKLMSVSQLVVIDVDDTNNVLWEIRNAGKLVNPRNLLISFLSKQDAGCLDLFYDRFAEKFNASFPTKLPAYHPNTFLVCFDDKWNPYPIKLYPIKSPAIFRNLPFLAPSTKERYLRVRQISNVLIPFFKANGILKQK